MLARNSCLDPIRVRNLRSYSKPCRVHVLARRRTAGGGPVSGESGETSSSKQSGADRSDSETYSPSLWSTVADSTSTFINQLITHFSGGKDKGDPPSMPFALKVFESALTKEKEVAASRCPTDLTPFLTSCGAWEIKHVRLLSALTAIVYKMHLVTPSSIKRRFNLDLVTCSKSCMMDQFVEGESPEDVCAEGDGMGVPLSEINSQYQDPNPGVEEYSSVPAQMSLPLPLPSTPSATPDVVAERLADAWGSAAESASSLLANAAGTYVRNFALLTSFDLDHATESEKARRSKGGHAKMEHYHYGLPNPNQHADLVALEAASAAYALSDHPDQPPLDSKTAAGRWNSAQAEEEDSKEELLSLHKVAVGLNLVAEDVDLEAQWSEKQAAMMSNRSLCPSEWFVCDDADTYTRYFVIQGSDSIDHWKMNFALDPVSFEDPSLRVKVHRGAYEAAEVLYQRFLPLVQEYLKEHPFAKIAFTGHSIGGSLATLLMIMYKHRGVLKEHNIATVYTFGAPPVFLEPTGAPHAVDHHHHAGEDGQLSCVVCEHGPYDLLSGEGLAEHVVRNVILPYDLVPRSMSCDFSPVADILRNMGSGFAQLCSLSLEGRKHLYAFVGRMMVLQPRSDLVFVANDDPHPMLPPTPGLWILTPPGAKSSSENPESLNLQRAAGEAEETSHPATTIPDSVPAEIADLHKAAPAEPSHITEAAHSVGRSPQAIGGKSGEQPDASPTSEVAQSPLVPSSVKEAVFELMDNPHPLEILADTASYGTNGSISRYHNPEHYTRALARLIDQVRREEMLSSPEWSTSSNGSNNIVTLCEGSAGAQGKAGLWEGSEELHGSFLLLSRELMA